MNLLFTGWDYQITVLPFMAIWLWRAWFELNASVPDDQALTPTAADA